MIKVYCAHCKKDFKIKRSHYLSSKGKKFYCCWDHFKLESRVEIHCLICGKKKIIHRSDLKIKNRGRFCSKKCARTIGLFGPNNGSWKGGRTRDGKGYILIRDSISGRYVREHRLIMGVIDPKIHVHHRNGIRDDNRIENLAILTASEHSVLENNIRWGNAVRDIT